MDWERKFLRLKYREKQSDWFDKRGLSWHISTVITRDPNFEGRLELRSYARLFDACQQDWFAVCSIIESILREIKTEKPHITWFICGQMKPLSETQGLWVDFKSGRKSPWGHCLTRLVPNGRSRSGIWLVPENRCVFLPNQSFVCFNTDMYKKLRMGRYGFFELIRYRVRYFLFSSISISIPILWRHWKKCKSRDLID